MKRLALALLPLALAACGTAPTDTAPAAVSAPAPLTDDDVFLGLLRIGGIEYNRDDPGPALDLAYNICAAFLEGNTASAIAGTITPAGYSQADADYIVESASDTYCPQEG